MGMFDGQQAEQGQAESQQDPTTSHGGFNGQVMVEGKPVLVKQGTAEVEGQLYFVSDNGAMVLDSQGRLIGHIDNGEFQLVTPDYTQKMRQAGYVK